MMFVMVFVISLRYSMSALYLVRFMGFYGDLSPKPEIPKIKTNT